MIDFKNKKSTREGFARGLAELSKNENVWLISADLSESLGMDNFIKTAPKRFIECGIAEQNAITIAAGVCMSNSNNIAIFGSFAEFLPYRCLDQIRISVCMQNLNVKLIGSHSGLSYGGDGESIQAFEDIAIMRTLPNMTVLVPASSNEAYKMTLNLAKNNTPSYMRLNREPDVELFDDKIISNDFHGKLIDGKDILIIACGSMVSQSIIAAKKIEQETQLSCTIYNASVIKPFPVHEVLELAKTHKLVVTCEEHQIAGGLGSVITEILCQYLPKNVLRIGINDIFGQSGTVEELRKHYQVDSEGIAHQIISYLSYLQNL